MSARVVAAMFRILLLLAVAGCAHTEAIYRGIYQGLQAREEMLTRSPAYGAPMPRLSYEEYDAARTRLLRDGPAK